MCDAAPSRSVRRSSRRSSITPIQSRTRWSPLTLVDSVLLVYGKYVRELSRDERDAYWQDYKVIGRLFALKDHEMPDTIEDFDAYMAGMLEDGEDDEDLQDVLDGIDGPEDFELEDEDEE